VAFTGGRLAPCKLGCKNRENLREKKCNSGEMGDGEKKGWWGEEMLTAWWWMVMERKIGEGMGSAAKGKVGAKKRPSVETEGRLTIACHMKILERSMLLLLVNGHKDKTQKATE
jgi:hypothetical protein